MVLDVPSRRTSLGAFNSCGCGRASITAPTILFVICSGGNVLVQTLAFVACVYSSVSSPELKLARLRRDPISGPIKKLRLSYRCCSDGPELSNILRRHVAIMPSALFIRQHAADCKISKAVAFKPSAVSSSAGSFSMDLGSNGYFVVYRVPEVCWRFRLGDAKHPKHSRSQKS
jgi:hypothetical protein